MRFDRGILILLLITIVSCTKENVNPDIKMMSHGISGFGSFNQAYPDNSESGLKYALSFPELDAIEVDLQLTKDSFFVCFHDHLLEGKTSGQGLVSSHNLSEVSNFKYLAYSNQSIMTFDELLSYDLSGVEVFIDVKTYNYIDPLNRQWYIDLIEEAILKLDCKRVSVFHENNGILSELDGVLADRYVHISSRQDGIDALLIENFEGVISRNAALSKDDWSYFKSQGLKSVIFDVRATTSFYDAFEKQSDYIIIDDIVKGIELK